MTRTLLDVVTVAVVAAMSAHAGWSARDFVNARRYRAIAESVRAERMEP